METKSENPLAGTDLDSDQLDQDQSSMGTQVAAFGDPDLLGISEEELDQQCDELFSQYPIRFEPRYGDPMDELIASSIYDNNFNIPIIWIKGKLYLIGSQRITC